LSYSIQFTEASKAALASIPDKRIQQGILTRIAKLKDEPEKQGKALIGSLDGYRSVRAVAQRYRIIYRIEADDILVIVIMLGLRKEGDKKDVYNLAKKLLKAGVLE
jgi:mRNA interferase RelE/StbE